jgi:hypothetical protein
MARGTVAVGLVVVLVACGSTEPDYPPFDGPAPMVSGFVMRDGGVSAILRDSEGGATIGRTDYTYVYFYRENTTDSHVSFAREWTWTRLDDLTWRVTVPLEEEWDAAAWHVADDESNVQGWVCSTDGHCQTFEEPV